MDIRFLLRPTRRHHSACSLQVLRFFSVGLIGTLSLSIPGFVVVCLFLGLVYLIVIFCFLVLTAFLDVDWVGATGVAALLADDALLAPAASAGGTQTLSDEQLTENEAAALWRECWDDMVLKCISTKYPT